jgi:hypothetical protein
METDPCNENTTLDICFSSLPPHLQSLILAYSAAPLNTCRAAAAILNDTPLLATWLRVREPSEGAIVQACDLQRWDVCQHLLSCDGYVACELELQLAVLFAAS